MLCDLVGVVLLCVVCLGSCVGVMGWDVMLCLSVWCCGVLCLVVLVVLCDVVVMVCVVGLCGVIVGMVCVV